jgi:hypothetical protein
VIVRRCWFRSFPAISAVSASSVCGSCHESVLSVGFPAVVPVVSASFVVLVVLVSFFFFFLWWEFCEVFLVFFFSAEVSGEW